MKEKRKELRVNEVRQKLRVKYRLAISKNKKVQERIAKISNDRLEKLLPVIDRLIKKVENNTRLSEEKINKKVATYNALKDIINDKLNNTFNDLEKTVNEILN